MSEGDAIIFVHVTIFHLSLEARRTQQDMVNVTEKGLCKTKIKTFSEIKSTCD